MSATSPTIAPSEPSRTATEDTRSRGEEDNKSIEDDSTQRAWSGRKGKPKTRTGCKTCKIRRIKCDEGKPFCSRCVKTGRVCDGYIDPTCKKSRVLPSSSSNVKLRPSPPSGLQFNLSIKFKTTPTLSIPRHPLDHPDILPRELRALEFFYRKTTNLMSNWIVGHFWKFQLPQVCHSEPAVRHALISLSATHEAMELRCGVGPTSTNVDKLERQRYACMHYNKSISQLAKVLSSRQDSDSEIVAMMVGSLFVVLKFMSGDFSTAVLHMHNEIEIYDSWRKRHGNDLIEGSLEWNVCTLVEKQCFNSPPISDTISRLPLQDEEFYDFGDFEEAREALHCVFREALRLIRLHRIIIWSDSDPFLDDLHTELDDCHLMLSKWLTGYNSLISLKQGRMTAEEEWDSETMHIMHFSIYVWLHVGIDHQSSPRKPEPLDLFSCLLTMGEDLHRRWCESSIPENSVTLSCESGVIPPLIFISTECSSIELRMRACRLLIDSSGMYNNSPMSNDDVPRNIAQLLGSAGISKEHSEKDVIEIEIEQGTQQLDLVIRPDKNGGWEVQHESIA